jgi:peptide/nickel transport system substrate-binding protein
MGAGSTSLNLMRIPKESHFQNASEKTIVIGTTDNVESTLDIAQAYDFFGWNLITCLSSGLVEIQPGSIAGNENILPALAERWAVSGNGTIWDFNLREGIVFENSKPFNASDVKYTFDRNCNLTGDGLLPADGPQFNLGYPDIIENVTIIDEYLVRFYLKIPFAPFLKLLAIPPSYIVDPSNAPKNNLVSYTEGNPRGSHTCGLGPFLLENWSRIGGSDNEIRLIANPDYWDAISGEPRVDRIIIKMYASATSLAAAKTADEIDIAFRHLTSSQIVTFGSMDNVDVYEAPNAQIQYLCFNQNIYPYNETLIRQGIAAALNRSYVCDAVFANQTIPLESIIPTNLEFYLPAFGIYGEANYSFTRAALPLFGYNETSKLSLDLYFESSGHYPQSSQQASAYQAQLESSGVIDVTLHGLDWPTYRISRDMGSLVVFIYGWYGDYSDADDYAFLPFVSWLNLGYDESHPQGGIDQYNLWLEGRSATNDTERRAAYYQLQELQVSECSIIPIWQGKNYVVADSGINSVYLDITGLLIYWLLDISEITTTTTTTASTTTTTTTTTTTNTTIGLPLDMITLIVSLSSVGVIVIIVILIINSRENKL